MYGGDALQETLVDETAEITQEDAWTVISAYFEEKGLVRQQLDSFNEFFNSNMQVHTHIHIAGAVAAPSGGVVCIISVPLSITCKVLFGSNVWPSNSR